VLGADVDAKSRAGKGTRTPDLLITSELLYRLSYPGAATESTAAAFSWKAKIRTRAARA
jgi:hypothetical protein